MPDDLPTFALVCPFCHRRNEIPGTLAGCVVNCPGCRRDLLAPMGEEMIEPIAPAASRRRFLPLAVALGVMTGASLGALLLTIPMWFYSLSVIGLGVRHVGIAGTIGGLIGALLGGLLGYRLCRD